ncbi:MAG TPA: JAB domain-containing protein [Ruminococcus flavefaciens]|nr:JAB domain-containing protein [Ruminococcus flavefaciens]
MLIKKVCLEIKEEFESIGPEYISNALEAQDFVYNTIGKKTVECFEVIFMDFDYTPIEFSIIGIGDGSKTNIDIAEIFKIALLSNAKHILVAHNHIGSSVVPTESDIKTTKEIGYIGKMLKIELIDSVVINSSNNYYSIRKHELEKAKNALE